MILSQCIESSLNLEIVKNKRKIVEIYSSRKLWKDHFFFILRCQTGQNSSVVQACGRLEVIYSIGGDCSTETSISCNAAIFCSCS